MFYDNAVLTKWACLRLRPRTLRVCYPQPRGPSHQRAINPDSATVELLASVLFAESYNSNPIARRPLRHSFKRLYRKRRPPVFGGRLRRGASDRVLTFFRLHPLQQARSATNPRPLISNWPVPDCRHPATDLHTLGPSSQPNRIIRDATVVAGYSDTRRPCRAPVLCSGSRFARLVLRVWPNLYYSYVRRRRTAVEHSRNVRQLWLIE